jgi:dihydrofolate reductase
LTPAVIPAKQLAMKVSIIVAMTSNRTIGLKGALPWRIPADMKWFKANTMGKSCIMGRKTWDSLPKKPLPGRANIVVTRDRKFHAEGATVVHDLAAALDIAKVGGAVEAMVIGGASLYSKALSIADRLYITDILEPFEGDVSFPEFDRRQWQAVIEERHLDATPPFVFSVMERIEEKGISKHDHP